MRSLGWLVVFTACGGSVAPDRRVEQPGAYGVATTRYTLADASRPLTVQAWAPAEDAVSDVAISQLEPEARRATYDGLLASAACATRTLPVAIDAVPASGLFPIVASPTRRATTGRATTWSEAT